MARVRREPGDEIGGYTVESTLGRGGSGAVYKVVDGGGAHAALKLVDAREDDVAAKRLEREVHALQSLRHPAVPQVLDAELDGDETFVVFEYIPGVSLWQHVQDHGPLTGTALAEFADRTASALDAVHAAGVVHRDVTPSNIMISPDGPVLIDFGLSHRAEDERLTRDGLVSGTAGYVAPEVIDGAEPGPIADRWAWAATVAYAMTGSAPFGAGTGAISRTLEANVNLPEVPGADALAAALGRDVGGRPAPADVVAALTGATVVLPAVTEAMEPTLVAPVGWHDEGTTVLPGRSVTDDADGPWDADEHDAAWSDEELAPQTDELARPTVRRPVMIAAWTLATAAGGALAPFVALAVLVVTGVVVRGWQRRAMAIAAVQGRRGPRRSDAALQTINLPWHLLRSLGESLPAALTASVAGGGVVALGWWLIDTGRLGTPAAQGFFWLDSVVLAVGVAVAAGVLWWGPLMSTTRDGAHRFAGSLAPTRGVAVAWTIVALTLVGVLAIAVYLEVDPWWWPLTAAPQF